MRLWGMLKRGVLLALLALAFLLPASADALQRVGRVGYVGQWVAQSYDANASALFAAMSVHPTVQRKALYNNLIVGLKQDGVWDKLDVLWVTAAHDSQAANLNLKNPATFTLTPTNNPPFTVDRGYSADGSTNYVDTNFAPSSNGVNYTQDSASIGVWSLTTSQSANATFGADNGSGLHRAALNPRTTLDTFTVRVNDNTQDAASNTNGSGLYVGNRSGASSKQGYKNGSQVITAATASTGLATRTVRFNQFSPALGSATLQSAGFMGGSLTSAEHQALYARLAAYMVGVGIAP